MALRCNQAEFRTNYAHGLSLTRRSLPTRFRNPSWNCIKDNGRTSINASIRTRSAWHTVPSFRMRAPSLRIEFTEPRYSRYLALPLLGIGSTIFRGVVGTAGLGVTRPGVAGSTILRGVLGRLGLLSVRAGGVGSTIFRGVPGVLGVTSPRPGVERSGDASRLR